MTIRIPLFAFAALVTFGAAAAAQGSAPASPAHPVLKSEAVVTSDIVRVGDLVANAGIIARIPIFRAPDLGSTGTVAAADVAEAVRAHALVGLDTAGITDVKVTRAARAIPARDIAAAITHALAAEYNLGAEKDITVTFERDMRVMYVDPAAKGEPRVARVSYDMRSGRFDAVLEIPTGPATRGTLRVAGRAQATAEVVTVARTVERGAVIKDSDLLIDRRPRNEVTRDILTVRDQAVGLAARATLQPGRALRGADLMRPELVQRSDAVTLVYEMPGIKVTMRGKATEAGAEGDTILVLNEQTKRTVHGTVAGPGLVTIGNSARRYAANER